MSSLHEAKPMTGAPAQVISADSIQQFVTFTCRQRAFGVGIMSVREIRSWSQFTELPNQPFGASKVILVV